MFVRMRMQLSELKRQRFQVYVTPVSRTRVRAHTNTYAQHHNRIVRWGKIRRLDASLCLVAKKQGAHQDRIKQWGIVCCVRLASSMQLQAPSAPTSALRIRSRPLAAHLSWTANALWYIRSCVYTHVIRADCMTFMHRPF